MIHAAARLSVLLLATAAAACSGSGPVDLEIAAAGSGVANTEPLLPMRVGSHQVYGIPGYLLHRIVAGAPQVDGVPGRRLEWSNGDVSW